MSATSPSEGNPVAAAAAQALIDLRNASRSYRMGEVEVRALDGVSLRVEAGDFVAITGASGSGKSTLLYILGCLDQPSAGDYFLDGRDVGRLSREERAEIRGSKIGFVFQNFNLLARTGAIENVELPLLYGHRDVASDARRDLARKALERVGLVGHESSMPSQLSGGEQQRVAIARAIVTEPLILLADEPTGNLDAKAADAIMAVLQELNASGMTILMVTHEPDIAACAKRALVMRDGHVVEEHAVRERRLPRVPSDRENASPARRRPRPITERLPISVQSLLRHRMRSFLTMLGVIIGVASVLTMLALGAGASESVQSTIASLGTDVIAIYPGAVTQSGARVFTGQSMLTVEDAEAIGRECPSVAHVTPLVLTAGQVVGGENNWATSIQGVGVEWPRIRAWDLEAGNFFTDVDATRAARVCVLGATVAENLFADQPAVGERVRIRNVPFQVVGVLERKGANLMGRDQDDVVVVPYTTLMRQLLGTTKINFIFASARSDLQIPGAEEEISALLRQRRHLIAGEEDDFALASQQEFASSAAETSRTLSLLLASIAVIALVVGGIGIMNIMLVSVAERTREIGLRLSVGAKPRQLLHQFLAESLTLAMIGGAIGILAGVAASWLLSRLGGWSTRVEPLAIVFSLGSAVVIGVLSGLYPARRASQLDPIQALRFE